MVNIFRALMQIIPAEIRKNNSFLITLILISKMHISLVNTNGETYLVK